MAAVDEQQEQGEYGVLLYYKYTPPIDDLKALYNFYESNCSSLGLLGRVRLASHGVNVTVGGKLLTLEKHIEAVKGNSLFEGTDFKLACCLEPLNDKVAHECGFTSLSIRIVKELVTLSSNPLLKIPAVSNAGRHLSAVEFHSVLNDAENLRGKKFGADFRKLVLLDARNLYETRIGKFRTPEVETLDPAIRQYSDLPTWIDNNVEELRGNHVLMYCTGGIRCEMASAYIRTKGSGFENVFQLYGGIQRYLEQFPDGGFFKGKNFVFDHRISIGSSNRYTLGSCLLCGVPFDDYSSRNRCAFCRMLVLVCKNCQKENVHYVCELCQRHGKGVDACCSIDNENSDASVCDVGRLSADLNALFPPSEATKSPQLACSLGVKPSRKLRILCLHGFRQNASGFKGRTGSLAKKLRSMVEFVFVDAPHELPFIYKPRGQHEDHKSLMEQQNPLPAKNCNKKYAWLISPEFRDKRAKNWEQISVPFDPLQYQNQTEGFNESLSYIKSVFSQQGPFDGILGFSQGAAMAALVCTQREKDKEINFSFVIICSGFAMNLARLERGSINCPSLHVFGKHLGKDRQIATDFSRDLACLFEERTRVIIEHDSGHIIPTQTPYIDEIRGFLQPFV